MACLPDLLESPNKRGHDGLQIFIRTSSDENPPKRVKPWWIPFSIKGAKQDADDNSGEPDMGDDLNERAVKLFDSLDQEVKITSATYKLNFAATTFANVPENAIRFAKRISELPDVEGGPLRLTYYVDASMGDAGSGAYAVVQQPEKDGEWLVQSWFVNPMFGIIWGELMAITEALHMATRRLGLVPASTAAEVYIFTDSMSSIDYLLFRIDVHRMRYDLTMDPLRILAIKLSHQLRDLGVKLTVSHVPGHKDVDGHNLADKAARNALRKKQGSSMSHNAIWTVVHDHSVMNLAAFNLRNPPTPEEAQEVKTLKSLLGLPVQEQKSKEKKTKIRRLRKKVGHFL